MRIITFSRLVKVLHPFLLAVFPFLFFLQQNPMELSVSQIVVPLAMTLGITGIVLINSYLLLKNPYKAAVVTSFLLVIFFSYGYVYDALLGISIAGMDIGRARYVLPAYGIIFILGIGLLIFTQRRLRTLSKFLNVVALVLVLVSTAKVVPYFFKGESHSAGTVPSASISEVDSNANATTGNPDIYYIILDAYANSRTLQDLFGYDNSPFLSYLADKGFYVVDKASSNFAPTQISLASSLNMEYVNYLADLVAESDNKDFEPTTELIENSKASQFLKDRGYQYVLFRSIWGPTSSSPYADVQLQGGKFDELTMLFVNSTLLRAGLLYPPVRAYFFSDFRERILYSFEQLGAMPEFNKAAGPKFVFAHILSPHPPYIFGPNGEAVPNTPLRLKPEDLNWTEEEKQRYIDQVVFLNKKIKIMVDQILAKSETPPIIIIQSDHGSWSTAGEDRANNHLYRERMRNFNALYLPNGGTSNLYETMTPVNSFRIIFNTYFGADFPLLEDRNYFSDSVSINKTRYHFIDVTDAVGNWDATWK